MQLARPEDFGTCANGGRINDYCANCYHNGAFTEPDITRSEMIARVATILTSSRQMSEVAARALANRVVPTLKRWTNSHAM
jgi:hypothetical protein